MHQEQLLPPQQTFSPERIQAHHRQRTACVYLRQSTMYQVMHHPQSTHRQYALQQKAIDYGWDASLVQILDADLGRSGGHTTGRNDFNQLVADVSLGQVGAIFVLEASRLSRSSADWNRLLELCSLTATLIIDQDGCYDPASFNDQLLLGLKGTMSQAELHPLKARLYGAKLHKAQKGELLFPLPVGYIVNEEGAICFDPDAQVCHVIGMVFDLFQQKQSVYGVVRYFGEHTIRFPKRAYGGRWRGKILWGRLTYNRALTILSHPFYAGVYTFGRHKSVKSINPQGEIITQSRLQPQSQWPVFIKDHHPAYISYDRFEQNRHQCLLNRSNSSRVPIAGPAREGATLLQGILYCRQCGRRMTIRYMGKEGRVPTYECNWRKREGLSGKSCLSFRADVADPVIEKAILALLTPAQLDKAVNAFEQVEKQQTALNRQWEMTLERHQYQVDLAQRRFEQVDPANRLVAASLEKSWNQELEKLAQATQQYEQHRQQQQQKLSALHKEDIKRLATRIPELWSATVSHKDKKRIVRLLIRDIMVSKRVPKVLTLQLCWQTGQLEEFEVALPLAIGNRLRYPPAIVEQVRVLTGQYGDDQLTAEALNRLGLNSATGKAFRAGMVQWIRSKHHIDNPLLRHAHELTVGEVARHFSISVHMVYYYITTQLLTARKTKKGLLIRVSPADDTAFRTALLEAPKAAPRKAIPTEGVEKGQIR
jgi:DNA invertase Pin-like site-specific DNA recombinase